jgi:hypothetical protein
MILPRHFLTHHPPEEADPNSSPITRPMRNPHLRPIPGDATSRSARFRREATPVSGILLCLSLSCALLVACEGDSVGPAGQPKVSFTSPTNDTQLATGDAFLVAVNASDADGTVASVALFVDAETTPRATATAAPYNFTLPAYALPGGKHILRAVATDDGGTTGEARISITANPAVYLVGEEENAGIYEVGAKYWKNGIAQRLYSTQQETSSGNAITISDNGTPFIAGSFYDGQSDYSIAAYWTGSNPNPIKLTDGSTEAAASSIAWSDGVVYVAGPYISLNGREVARYWRNGVAIPLTDGTFQTVSSSITISDGVVYVTGGQREAGSGEFVARYWRSNGPPVILPGGSYATGIAISGGDVHVSGFKKQSGGASSFPVYWKNGEMTVLGTEQTWHRAVGIAVK